MGLDKSDLPHLSSALSDPLTLAVHSRDASVMSMVEEAIAQRRVVLAFQPVVQATRQDHVAFYEGLIRVLDVTGRIIPAREFIDQIEATNLGREIDCLALQLGLKTLAEQPGIRLSINMSARSIGYPRWGQALKRGLARDATVAERLILEITESSAMLVPELVVTFMSALQKRGISFAMDDFGAGQTSLRYFKDFLFDILKIDGQFIRGIHKDPDNQILTRAMVLIAQQFDMFTVAENVERAEDVAILCAMGVDCLQGYYYAAPTTTPLWAEPQLHLASA